MLRIPFRVIAPDVDEHVLAGEQADAYVTRLARAKAQAVVARAPGEVILAADTTVALRGKIFEKPTSPQNAVEMLEQLQGQTHKVLTAARPGLRCSERPMSRAITSPAASGARASAICRVDGVPRTKSTSVWSSPQA